MNADHTEIPDTHWREGSFTPAFEINKSCDDATIAMALRRAGAWKALGPDWLANGFLRACGYPLWQILASLVEASL